MGRSTAAAIAAFAAGERRAILDGNVKRVIARHAGIGGDPSSSTVLTALWAAAEARLPARGMPAYTQGMMDLGAAVCLVRNPLCESCPVRSDCIAANEDRVVELPGQEARGPQAPAHHDAGRDLARRSVAGKAPFTRDLGRALVAAGSRRIAVPPRRRGDKLPAFEHAFTHFTLEVQPWRIDAAARRAHRGRGRFALAAAVGPRRRCPARPDPQAASRNGVRLVFNLSPFFKGDRFKN